MKNNGTAWSLKTRIRLLVFALLGMNLLVFLFRLLYLKKHAINIPLMDEWEFFNPDQLASGLSLKWLFTAHNEHRIVFTKLLGYILYHMNGWNVVQNQILSFIVFGFVCGEILWMIWKNCLRTSHFCIVAAISPLLFSSVNWDNHSAFFNIPFHLFVLFFIPACFLLLSKPASWLRASVGGLCCLCTVLSFTSGMVCVLALMGVMLCLSRFRERYQNWIVLVPSLIAIFGLLIYRNPGSALLVFPWKLDFWKTFFGMFAGALGIARNETTFGFIYFSLAVLPLFLYIFSRSLNIKSYSWKEFEETYLVPNGFWVIQTFLIGLILSVAMVSVGRTSLGGVIHSSRYSETTLFMTPVVVFSLLQLPSSIKKVKFSAVIMILIFSGVGLSNSFHLEDYNYVHDAKVLGIKCMCKFLKEGGTALCPSLYPYPGDITLKLTTAKQLGVSFVREAPCNSFDLE